MGNLRSSERLRLKYAVFLSVSEIVRTSKYPTFVTFTFADNVVDKAEAARRWRRLKARLQRHYEGLRGVGMWQRQGRGAWHLHCVWDRRLDVVEVREWAKECGFGPQLNCRWIGDLPGMKQSKWTVKKVADYLTRYLVRDAVAPENPESAEWDDSGVRLVDYCGDCRVATTNFRWSQGMARLYRFGRQVWDDIFGGSLPEGESAVDGVLQAYWFICRLGWEIMTPEQRKFEWERSDRVKSWTEPELYPF